jgi:hypothetical protein
MRHLKPIVSMLMALLIGITSLGMAVSAHTCSEAGVAETSIGHLKACCKQVEGPGIQAEPCCKVSVQHVKLATVRHLGANSVLGVPIMGFVAPAMLPCKLQAPSLALAVRRHVHPPDKPPISSNLDAQAELCRFLI